MNADLPEVGPASDGVPRVCQWVDITCQFWRDCGKLQVIRNKSLSTLQCKFLEMCMETMCNQVAKLFSVLWLLIWFGCVVRCFPNGERGQSVWGPQRLRQLGGWNRLVWGTGKVCAGQSTCKRRLLKRSVNTWGTFMELKAGAHCSAQTYCVHSPKHSSFKVHTRQVYLCRKPCCL